MFICGNSGVLQTIMKFTYFNNNITLTNITKVNVSLCYLDEIRYEDS